MRNWLKNFKIWMLAWVAILGMGVGILIPTYADDPDSKPKCETSILPGEWCGGDTDTEGKGIKKMVVFVVNLLTAGVAVVGTIGMIIVGVTWMTARDNEAQVKKARERLVNIVIGLALLILLDFILNLLLGTTFDEVMGVLV